MVSSKQVAGILGVDKEFMEGEGQEEPGEGHEEEEEIDCSAINFRWERAESWS